MKKKLVLNLFTIGLLLFSVSLEAQSKKEKQADAETLAYRYELECYGTGVQGTYSVKVWSYSKKPEIAKEQCKKNAIHGVIFKGIVSGPRCMSQPPLAGDNANLYQEHKDFFNSFFRVGGKYMQFVNITNDGTPLPGDMIKVGKKEYKVGIVVSVRKDALRKYLEDEKILRKLTDGF